MNTDSEGLCIYPFDPKYNIHYQRCECIKKQLLKYNIVAQVSRHSFQDNEYYVIEIDLNGNNSHITVAKALNISETEVHFIHINISQGYKIYWISETLLHELYLNQHGELSFLEQEAKEYIESENTRIKSITNKLDEIIIRVDKL